MNYNSKIILCKDIKLDKDYVNVLSYSVNDMLTLLNSNTHKIAEANDYTFIDRNRKIRVAFTYEQCLQANYIAFQNPSYSNKWFFAFIENVEFKGNNNTEITFKVDSWTTFFEDWTKKACYVIRQHVNDDTIGLHTVPENLDVGEIIQDGQEVYDSAYTDDFGYYIGLKTNWIILPGSNSDNKLGIQYLGVSVFNKNVFGTKVILFKIESLNSFKDLIRYLIRTNIDGHIGDVKEMFIIPSALVTVANLTQYQATTKEIDIDTGTETNVTFTYYLLADTNTIETFNTTVSKLTSFTGINVKNNKLKCYPYNYLYVTNNAGNSNIYRYEDFSGNDCVFENQLALTIGCSGRLVPKNYKGIVKNDDEAIPLAKYPTCGWSSDAYTNWLTQQAVNLPTKISETVINTAKTTVESASVLGGAMSLAGSIAGFIGEFYSAKLLPNVEQGQNTGDVQWGNKKICFTFRHMRAKNEYLEILDDYMSRYGYQINRVILPNITGRQNWNYVEIGESESIGYGSVPTNFMNEINNACRKGVTIWHNHANLGDFSLSNTIVT